MTQIPVDIISGFLGAGKTTLIRKLLSDSYQNQKIFLLENEYGQVGIDGALLAKQDVEMKEIYSGCICCSLKGDFTRVLLESLDQVKPQRIIIEPTGVGKLSEILSILEQKVFKDKLIVDHILTVVDARKGLIYLKNFGEFFKDQLRHAQTLILSKTKGLDWQKIQELVQVLKPLNPNARWVTTPWEELAGSQILRANIPIETFLTKGLSPLIKLPGIKRVCNCHEEMHHHHVPGCGCQQHSHSCSCDPSEQHGHNAAEVFHSWSWESPKEFNASSLQRILSSFQENKKYGQVLRAKGIVPGNGEWLHFEYVSGDWDIAGGTPQLTGRAVVIGVNLKVEQLRLSFEE
ncbi:CobW family GTP-binding protein [Desulfotomaculum sp. 1211_IL3151]|uniref:CobW family GTP-binding protein n=1 Tax=Desulfotomaculum sp. 1211_IL3151 TaxID=3084055 RepID=UPI002FD9A108